MTADDETGRIERVARAICQADGFNPDEMVSDPNAGGPPKAGTGLAAEFSDPRWKTYIKKAKILVAAYSALSGSN